MAHRRVWGNLEKGKGTHQGLWRSWGGLSAEIPVSFGPFPALSPLQAPSQNPGCKTAGAGMRCALGQHQGCQ